MVSAAFSLLKKGHILIFISTLKLFRKVIRTRLRMHITTSI
jgi:hypothetical protein